MYYGLKQWERHNQIKWRKNKNKKDMTPPSHHVAKTYAQQHAVGQNSHKSFVLNNDKWNMKGTKGRRIQDLPWVKRFLVIEGKPNVVAYGGHSHKCHTLHNLMLVLVITNPYMQINKWYSFPLLVL